MVETLRSVIVKQTKFFIMSNMSYCRFENTSRDVQDCIHAIENGETQDLSNYEIEGLESLLLQAQEIVSMSDTIERVLSNTKSH